MSDFKWPHKMEALVSLVESINGDYSISELWQVIRDESDVKTYVWMKKTVDRLADAGIVTKSKVGRESKIALTEKGTLFRDKLKELQELLDDKKLQERV